MKYLKIVLLIFFSFALGDGFAQRSAKIVEIVCEDCEIVKNKECKTCPNGSKYEEFSGLLFNYKGRLVDPRIQKPFTFSFIPKGGDYTYTVQEMPLGLRGESFSFKRSQTDYTHEQILEIFKDCKGGGGLTECDDCDPANEIITEASITDNTLTIVESGNTWEVVLPIPDCADCDETNELLTGASIVFNETTKNYDVVLTNADGSTVSTDFDIDLFENIDTTGLKQLIADCAESVDQNTTNSSITSSYNNVTGAYDLVVTDSDGGTISSPLLIDLFENVDTSGLKNLIRDCEVETSLRLDTLVEGDSTLYTFRYTAEDGTTSEHVICVPSKTTTDTIEFLAVDGLPLPCPYEYDFWIGDSTRITSQADADAYVFLVRGAGWTFDPASCIYTKEIGIGEQQANDIPTAVWSECLECAFRTGITGTGRVSNPTLDSIGPSQKSKVTYEDSRLLVSFDITNLGDTGLDGFSIFPDGLLRYEVDSLLFDNYQVTIKDDDVLGCPSLKTVYFVNGDYDRLPETAISTIVSGYMQGKTKAITTGQEWYLDYAFTPPNNANGDTRWYLYHRDQPWDLEFIAWDRIDVVANQLRYFNATPVCRQRLGDTDTYRYVDGAGNTYNESQVLSPETFDNQ